MKHNTPTPRWPKLESVAGELKIGDRFVMWWTTEYTSLNTGRTVNDTKRKEGVVVAIDIHPNAVDFETDEPLGTMVDVVYTLPELIHREQTTGQRNRFVRSMWLSATTPTAIYR